MTTSPLSQITTTNITTVTASPLSQYHHYHNIATIKTSFYCVLQISLCESHCNGCAKVAWRRGCGRNTVVYCSWKS
jgi:hypothetical protein